MSNNIFNYNSKGQLHGYQERYLGDKLWCKCFFNNNIPIDYEEYYPSKLEKCFHI